MTSYLKAIVGSIVAGLGALYQALDNGAVSAQEWVAVALAAVATLGAVYGVPNRDPEGQRQTESVQPPDQRGAGEVRLILCIAAGVLLVLAVLWLVR